MASAGRPQAGRTAARLCRWFVPKKSLCSLPKVKAFPREQWLQSLWSPASLRRLEVSKGERREAGIQWIQPPKAVSDRSFRQTTSGAHGSANRADCLPRGKPFGAPAGAGLLLPGTDAPTAAREWDLQSQGAFILFFRWRKKSMQKKASGTATLAARPAMRRGLRSAVAPSGLSSTLVRFAHPSGKKAPIAHFDGGARNVARNGAG